MIKKIARINKKLPLKKETQIMRLRNVPGSREAIADSPRAIEKCEDIEINNLRFIRMEAEYIQDVFEKDEVDRIYLNFSDPWPKDRHAKRRLTSKQFFERYDGILKKDGIVEFKTDNDLLFQFSLEQVPEAGWNLDKFTWDLHNDEEMVKGNVMTEYESKFSAMGNPIHKLIASR